MVYIPPQPQIDPAKSRAQVVGQSADPKGGDDVVPRTFSAQGVPIPIAYGLVKLPINLIEKLAPGERVAPMWVASTQYYTGNQINSWRDGGYCAQWECVHSGVSGTDQYWAYGPANRKNVADGGCLWNYIADTGRNQGQVNNSEQKTFNQNFLAVLAEGPIVGGYVLHVDKQSMVCPSNTESGFGLFTYLGPDAENQTVPSPWDQCGYQHSALIGTSSGGMDTATQSEIPNIALVTKAVDFGEGLTGVNPADMIADLVTHSRRGAGYSATVLDSSITGTGASTYRTYCAAAGFYLACVIDSKRSVLSIIADILLATNSDAFWSQAKLHVVPLGDVEITNPEIGSTTYTPPTTPVYDFGLDDFLDRSAPVQIKRRSQADCFNAFPVEYTDQLGYYCRTTVEDPDQADVDARGLYRAGPVSLPFLFFNGKPAVRLSRIFAQRSMLARCQYSFKVGWQYIRLEPLDVVTLTAPLMGLSLQRVRVLSVEESPDGISVLAEDYPAGAQHASSYVPQDPGAGYRPNEKLTKATIPSQYSRRFTMDLAAVDGDILRAVAGVDTSNKATSASLAASSVTSGAIAAGAVVAAAIGQNAVAPYHVNTQERRTSLLGNATFGNWTRG